MTARLRIITAEEVVAMRREPFDAETLAESEAIVREVRAGGEGALRRFAERFGDIEIGAPLVIPRSQLAEALAQLDDDAQRLLARTAARIKTFAEAQLRSLTNVVAKVPGGRAGQRVDPVQRVGCYAPGGRFPLVSTVLMTVIPARVAGVASVWVASPRPSALIQAAAAVAGADAVVSAGGAQVIAALAYGAGPIAACDMIVGPGNKWVTAAKWLVSRNVGIDMLAGPSELVVVADETANAATIAADLLAQAEHDPDALPVLLATSPAFIERVNDEIEKQVATLPTASTAAEAIAGGFAVAADLDTAIDLANRLAPEHLELAVRDAESVAERCQNYGGLFIGSPSAEVFGDYGVGPNHTLPTGGAARFTGGLSPLSFLRVHTWLHLMQPADAAEIVEDAAALARLEGLEAHARSAERRR
ncbi:MAG: histidinol dehydrogenase [Candidatus Lernaella stagnicola]|nr:histidinol dehydrogenase [Candidatus Lernaella stagnicola]